MYQRVHTGFTGVYVRGVYDLPVHTLDKLRTTALVFGQSTASVFHFPARDSSSCKKNS
jgi:hypothetical protein